LLSYIGDCGANRRNGIDASGLEVIGQASVLGYNLTGMVRQPR
jgi:hypothetical protein